LDAATPKIKARLFMWKVKQLKTQASGKTATKVPAGF